VELRQFLKLLRRWAWVVAVNMIIAATAAYLVSQRVTPTYQASSLMLVNQAPINSAGLDFNTVRSNESLAKTYAQLFLTRPVLETVIAKLKLDTTPGRLVNAMTVRSPGETQLLELTVRGADPQLAAGIANETVRVFIEQNQDRQALRYGAGKESLQQELDTVRATIENTLASLNAIPEQATAKQTVERNQLQLLLTQQRDNYTTLLRSLEEVRLAEAQTTAILNVVEPAYAPASPILPNSKLNSAIAAIVAATVVIAIAGIAERFDDSVKSSEDLERLLGIPMLAGIAAIKGSDLPKRLVTLRAGHSPIAEGYRRLRTNIEFCAVDRPIQTLVITSSGPFEGKSTTAANLAITLAQTGKSVVLVDTDLRRPTLHKYFLQTDDHGVTTALLRQPGEPLAEHMVASRIENLSFMASGPLPPNPAELLGSARMNELIEELKRHADYIIFDTPPLLPVVDASLLAHRCDAAVLVAMANSTRRDALVNANDQLLQSGTSVLGVVLNAVATSSDQSYLAHDPQRWRYLRWWHNLKWRFFLGS
jgi:capsular exopolysaccharide synthesis family protein